MKSGEFLEGGKDAVNVVVVGLLTLIKKQQHTLISDKDVIQTTQHRLALDGYAP